MKHFYQLFFTMFSVVFLGFTAQVSAQSGNTCSSAIPIEVHLNECYFTTVSNQGLTNSGVTPSGCVGYSGGDLWLSVELPESGEVYFHTEFLQGGNLLMDINLAYYSGTCGNLQQLGCEEDGAAGWYPGATLVGEPGEVMYIQLWEVGNDNKGQFNVCANGTPMCNVPQATIIRQCLPNSQYSISLNVTSLGDAAEINILNDAGLPGQYGISSTGTYVLGTLPLNQDVTITLEHTGDQICNNIIDVTATGLGCEQFVSCGNPVNIEYCYKNNDGNKFLYSSIDGSPLTIYFNAGDIQPYEYDPDGTTGDRIVIRNGKTITSPVLYVGDHDGDLSGLSVTASSGSIFIHAYTDAGGSCQDGALGIVIPWNYDVFCELEEIPACEDAIELVSQTTYAATAVTVDYSSLGYSGLAQCAGEGENPDQFFKFTAVNTLTYIRVDPGTGFDAAVEVYDQCGGTLMKCVNETGPGQRETFWISDLTPGEEYVFRVYHTGANMPSNQSVKVAIAHIPKVHVRPQDCGRMDLEANSIIRAITPNPNWLTEKFIWEFTELEEPYNTYTVHSPNGHNPNFRMFWFPNFQQGRTYSVRVKAVMYEGPNEGDYGQACTIGFSNSNGTALQSVYHDEFFQLCDIIKAEPMGGTSNYRWTFTEGENTIQYNSNSSSYVLTLHHVNGLQLGKSYEVQVYATHNGVETTVSEPRTINMVGSVPNTSINPQYHACGSTVKLSQWTQAMNICGATSYTFRFVNLTNPELPASERTQSTRVLVFNNVPGLIPGHTYQVSVKAEAGGLSGDFSSTCEFTIFDENADNGGGDNGGGDNGGDDNGGGDNGGDNGGDDNGDGNGGDDNGGENEGYQGDTAHKTAILSLEDALIQVNPNPAKAGSEVIIEISKIADNQQEVTIEIYDMNGKLVQMLQLGNNGNSLKARVKLGNKVTSGVYIVNTLINGKHAGIQKLMVE